MYRGQLPTMWKLPSYPSLKPLSGYVSDLVRKLAFLSRWASQGLPPVVWLPGIHFTHSFLTATLQNSARRQRVAIDEIEFDFEFFPPSEEEKTEPAPEVGVLVSGFQSRSDCFNDSRWKSGRL